jgi:Type IV secretion system pilin
MRRTTIRPPSLSDNPGDRVSGAAEARRHRRRWLLSALLVAAALATVVSAAAPASATSVIAGSVQVVAVAGSVGEVLTNIRNWLMGILAGLATVFATLGGVRYVMANGDPGEVEKAKTAFRSAGVGYALAALAPLLVTILKGIVGA